MLSLDIRAAIAQAAEALARDDLAGTEQAAQAVLTASGDRNGDALHLLGLVRIRQDRLPEAAALLRQAIQLQPGQPRVLLNYAKVLAGLGQPAQAAAMLSEALRHQPGLAEAWHELGNQQHRLGQPAAAEKSQRQALALEPGHGWARLALGQVLLELGRAADAETVLDPAANTDTALTAALTEHLAQAQARQNKPAAALESLDRLKALDPERPRLDAARFDLLHALGRFDEALALMRDMVARTPADPDLHKHYNALLYQLGREEEMFASYDQAPPSTALAMDKGHLMEMAGRHSDAQAVFEGILAREPDNFDALVSAAAALTIQKRHQEAAALLEGALARTPQDLRLRAAAGNVALHARDAEKAAALLETVVAQAPHDHNSLARLGTAWRMLGDAREEALMDYDGLIAVFDLEPPQGFSDMAAFNAELEDYLAGLHPPTREFLGQSLRSGTQTLGHLFGANHDLVERLKARIDQSVARYIEGLKPDAAHPLRGRRAAGFAYAGSWSSRLSDCGFHVNHIHPMGWISSCYYVGVPGAVADETARQGWIKFGEPNFDTGLTPRRAIQPKPGRLVLFPSYMWHGTIPFQDKAKRTTIAFDVVPT